MNQPPDRLPGAVPPVPPQPPEPPASPPSRPGRRRLPLLLAALGLVLAVVVALVLSQTLGGEGSQTRDDFDAAAKAFESATDEPEEHLEGLATASPLDPIEPDDIDAARSFRKAAGTYMKAVRKLDLPQDAKRPAARLVRALKAEQLVMTNIEASFYREAAGRLYELREEHHTERERKRAERAIRAELG